MGNLNKLPEELVTEIRRLHFREMKELEKAVKRKEDCVSEWK